MRLIDADALKEDLTRFYENEVTARQLIDEQPTVEAEPVMHGEWIWWGYGWMCSKCDGCTDNIDHVRCPWCGAIMDGGDHEVD